MSYWYNIYINMEIYIIINIVKYIHKYIYKKKNQITLQLRDINQINKITIYIAGYYIKPTQTY